MKIYYTLIVIWGLSFFGSPLLVSAQDTLNPAKQWDILDKQIVNVLISKDSALLSLQKLEPLIIDYFYKNGGKDLSRTSWVFPMANYTEVIHRENDYRLDGYDYFQGTNTKGHAAHDIFILDEDKDVIDDETGKPVDVVSMSSGVVVAVDTTWRIGSALRGGKYVKVYDVTNKGIFYYSHLSKVTVLPGTIVSAGDKVGEVGRTGRFAVRFRGMTHLHVGFLNSVNGYPTPENINPLLIKLSDKKE